MVQFSTGSFVVITGGSRGIGREIAIEASKRIGAYSTIILMARSEKGLNETKEQILKINKYIKVDVYPLDLAKTNKNDYHKALDTTLSSINKANIKSVYIFHNAGQVGTLAAASTLEDLEVWRKYFDLNLFSVAILNSVFMKMIKPLASKSVVVNITSVCGSKPFKHMSMYGTGKAARNIFFQVLAEEEKDIRVLNYSPGPVDTLMIQEITENVKDYEMLAKFQSMQKNKSVLTTEQTVKKLMDILSKEEFNSGDVIDYFGRI